VPILRLSHSALFLGEEATGDALDGLWVVHRRVLHRGWWEHLVSLKLGTTQSLLLVARFGRLRNVSHDRGVDDQSSIGVRVL
jgi:hypothetical protein